MFWYARYSPGTTLEITDMEAWDKVMAVNVRSDFQRSKRTALWMKDHGGGKIVNIGSHTAISGVPENLYQTCYI
jgi:NAD(P)-dependent dehydrogenase (short-subunit alcohol dehydrogenase family)